MNTTHGTENTQPSRTAQASDSLRMMLGIGGLVAIVIGVLILVNPLKTGAAMMQVLAVVMAAYALIVGITYVGSAIFTRGRGGWARTGHVLLGLLFIIGGIVLLSNLVIAAEVTVIFLSVTVGVLWIFEGIMAFTARSESRAWSIIFGIVSVLAGLVLIFSPFVGAFTLWLLLAISLIAMGFAQAVRAFTMQTAGS